MSFYNALVELCKEHNINLVGTMRVICDSDSIESRSLQIVETVYHGGIKDNTGPFLVGSIEHKAPVAIDIRAGKTIHINPDIAGYDCPVTGKWISSRKDHRENLKRTDCRLQEPGEKQEFVKNRDRMAEAALDRQVSHAVRSVAHHFE